MTGTLCTISHNQVKDMKRQVLTEGNITKEMVDIATPLIAGNILQQLYNTVDAFVIGRFASQNEFAAIGVAGTVMNLFLFVLVGACSGISVLFAQLYGQNDMKRFRNEHFLSLTFGLAGTLVLAAAGLLLMPLILKLIQTPETIAGYTSVYLRVILLCLPFSYLYNLYSSLLRAVGSTKAALLVLAGSTAMNVVLDLYFVAVLHKGIFGAAVATGIAQAVSALLCVLVLRLLLPDLFFRKEDCRFNPNMFGRSVRFAAATALHQSGLYIGKLLVQGAVNTGGTALISAYTATTRIEGFANSFGDSGAAATSILTAQNYGAGNTERVKKTYRVSRILLILLGIVCAVIMFVFAPLLSSVMLGKGAGEAYVNTVQYLRVVAVFYIFCFSGNTFAGYFDGVGKVTIPMIGAIGHIMIRVVLSWLWIGRMGLSGVALATGIGWVLANIFWEILYRKLRIKS